MLELRCTEQVFCSARFVMFLGYYMTLLHEAILLFLGQFHINYSIHLQLQNAEKTRV